LFSDDLYSGFKRSSENKAVEIKKFVIPAQAAIQTLIFQNCLKVSLISNHWIPAYAGMTE
jgi:hypothetical protein